MDCFATLDSVEKLTSQNWLGADPYDAAAMPQSAPVATGHCASTSGSRERFLRHLPWRELEAYLQDVFDSAFDVEMPDPLCS